MVDVFNKEISQKILQLAEKVLDSQEIKGANLLSEMLLKSEKDRKHAIGHIQELVGVSPKRPVYYLNYEITGLPEHTRHVVRYAGDYIDQLIKHCSYEKGDFLIFKFRGLHRSLGSNLVKLNKVLPKQLLDILIEFNEIIYVPSKHEWDVQDRPHLFSAREAVFVCFIVKKLASKIIPYSPMAQIYNANQTHNYHYDSTQK